MAENLSSEIIHYCRTCADLAFREWEGWPNRDPVPILPRIIDGHCESCGSSDSVSSDQLVWVNQGPGLPSHWIIVSRDSGNDRELCGLPGWHQNDPDWYMKWGKPYDHEQNCPSCGSRSVVSKHGTVLGNFIDYARSCSNCGLRVIWEIPRGIDKAVQVIVTNVLLKTEGGDWDSDSHKAVRYLLNKVGHTEKQAGKVDPDRVVFRMIRKAMSKRGVTFDTEEEFGEFLDSFRAYALIELTFNDKTPLHERLDFK